MLSYLTLSIDHMCAYSQFSKLFPDIEVNIWCKDAYDIIIIQKGIDKFSVLKDYIEKEIGSISHFYIIDSVAHLILKQCYCVTTPLAPIFKNYHSIEIPPTTYRNGKELVQLIITTDEIDPLTEDLKSADDNIDLSIVSVNHLKKSNLEFPYYISLNELIKGLTKRQFQSLIAAYQNGYYKIPREITIEELAKQLKIKRKIPREKSIEDLSEQLPIGRKTFEEHLRKAENKIMKNIIPALLFAQEEPKS